MVFGEGHGRGDAQHAADVPLLRGYLFFRLIDLRDDAPAALIERASLTRQADMARRAIQQPHAEPILESKQKFRSAATQGFVDNVVVILEQTVQG